MIVRLLLISILLPFSVFVCSRQQFIAEKNAPTLQTSASLIPKPSPSPTPSLNEINFIRKSVDEGVASFYKIEASYPQIEDLRTKHARAFNRWVEQLILNDVAEFRELEKAAMKRHRDLPPFEESLSIWYEEIFANRDLISILFTRSVMTLGQGHPITYPVEANYDLKSGRLLRLGNLFNLHSNYLGIISQYCRVELSKNERYRESPEAWRNEGTEPRARNFGHWNIKPEGLLISFDDYQVGPHSIGRPQIFVPYSAFKGMIAENSVISSFVGK